MVSMDLQAPPKRDAVVSPGTWTSPWSSSWLQDKLNSPPVATPPPSESPVKLLVQTANMKLYYLGILKNDTRPSTELAFESDLSSFSRFMRGNYLEVMQFAAATVGERTKPGQRQSVEQENTSGVVHAYGRSEGICGVAITDAEYPSLVAHQVLSKIVDEFLNKHPVSSFSNSTGKVPYPELKDYIVKYQNPAEADSIMKIQNELDETKIVLHKTIQSVLERGENISKLEDQSARLSASTNMFMKQAKKQNSCCILM